MEPRPTQGLKVNGSTDDEIGVTFPIKFKVPAQFTMEVLLFALTALSVTWWWTLHQPERRGNWAVKLPNQDAPQQSQPMIVLVMPPTTNSFVDLRLVLRERTQLRTLQADSHSFVLPVGVTFTSRPSSLVNSFGMRRSMYPEDSSVTFSHPCGLPACDFARSRTPGCWRL